MSRPAFSSHHRLAHGLLALIAIGSTVALGGTDLIVLTPSQRANAGIETVALDDSATRTSAGLTVTGRVEIGGGARALLTAPAAGRIAELSAYPGSPVKRGQPLLTLTGPEIAGLQRALREARATATAATQRVTRDRALLAEGVIASSRLEQSEAAASAAGAQLREAMGALSGASVESRDGQGIVVRAPIDGVLAGPRLVAGAAVAAGDALAVIGASGRLRLALAASPEVARALATGDTMLVRSRGCEATAILRAVGTSVDASQAVPLAAEVSDEYSCLLPGEALTAVLSPRSAARGSWALPPRAFVRRGAGVFVFVDRRTGFEPVEVDAAAARAGFARATTLKSGDRVAITGSALLKGAWIGLAGEE